MSDPFERLREVLRGRAEIPASLEEFPEACHQRLLGALRKIGKITGPGPADLACLVRHVLRREEELQSSINQMIRVPRQSPWPDKVLWERCGITVLDDVDGDYLVQARAWKPDWLPHATKKSPETAAYAEEKRRHFDLVSGDPFLSLMGYRSYRSIGHREAVRAVLTAPPGATLTINLPTGSGKSLCAQLPALLLSLDFGLTVVVVPTTSLAIDQQRAMADFISHPTAYFGDSTAEAKQRRAEIRERIRRGTQRIVFTSPESLMNSLAGPLYEASELGLLRMFVIDEAHMIEQWGDDFRSEFQEIAGLRRGLLRVGCHSPFVTLLMTATLTDSCLDALELFFGDPGPFEVTSAAQLRPEPGYWHSYCSSEDIRHERLLEALCNLPRPLILYATKIKETRNWATALQNIGFKRIDVVTGETPGDRRARVIDDWRERNIDIIVANAAFGLGVDQADVRSIVHACIPETLDRFYQEVGRGGRDGKASVSLVLYTKSDFAVAAGMNRTVFIRDERGLERWQRMFAAKQSLPDDRYRVPVNVTPSMRPGDINMDNQKNRDWNIRTLTLMCRAGLIQFDSEPPPKLGDSGRLDPETVTNEKIKAYLNERVIRICNYDHLQQETWQADVQAVRNKRKAWNDRSLGLMKEALKGKRCIADLLSEAYKIPARQTHAYRAGAVVGHACGGCPYCRANSILPYITPMPRPLPSWRDMSFPVEPELRKLLAGYRVMAIFYDTGELGADFEDQILNLLVWFNGQGVRNVVATREILEKLAQTLNGSTASIAFFFERLEPLFMPPVPTVVLHAPIEAVPPVYLVVNRASAPRVLLLPMSAKDPASSHRCLFDSFNGPRFRLDEFCTVIGL